MERVEPHDVHGGADAAELARRGLRASDVLDFSANLNPFASNPAIAHAIKNATLNRYPDRSCGELREELARRHGVPTDHVLVGNGSSELIWLAAVAYLDEGDRAVVLGPTFSGYRRAALLMGASVFTCEARAADDFCPPLEAFDAALREHGPRLAFLANPNNPTGKAIAMKSIVSLSDRHPQTLFVLDEAYADCRLPSTEPSAPMPANVLRFRSLTKLHGLAGVRLGYALGAPDLIAALRAAQPTWSVNALAQAAGVAALKEELHFQRGLARWLDAGADLVARLAKVGFAPVSSIVPFFLLPVRDARQTRSLLLRHGILVRDCNSFGLPGHVRISALRPEENLRLVNALERLRGEIGA